MRIQFFLMLLLLSSCSSNHFSQKKISGTYYYKDRTGSGSFIFKQDGSFERYESFIEGDRYCVGKWDYVGKDSIECTCIDSLTMLNSHYGGSMTHLKGRLKIINARALKIYKAKYKKVRKGDV